LSAPSRESLDLSCDVRVASDKPGLKETWLVLSCGFGVFMINFVKLNE
jgi:hypothetical protein